MIWTTFLPVLNEADIIETKIIHSLSHFQHVVIVEGSIPQTYNVGADGLSTDGTTEILKSYADKIDYIPAGKCKNRMELQNHALNLIRTKYPDTEILHRTDADEFEHERLLTNVEQTFATKDIWFLYTNLINLIDPTRARENIAPLGTPFPFTRGKWLRPGMYHERFYRYRNDLAYVHSAHCLTDSIGRPLFAHPDYYFQRDIYLGKDISDSIFHYKYIDGFEKILKAEMSYLAEDEHMQPYTEEIFNAALERVKKIIHGNVIPIEENRHCREVQNAKWFKYEPWKFNTDITFDEFMKVM